MKRYIVLSVNDDPEYLQYVPLAVWAWRKIDWDVILFYEGHQESRLPPDIRKLRLKKHEGYRSDTITQVSRLYGAVLANDGDIVMTGDIDLIPLSNYWNPDPNRITVYGHDLTNHGEIPICYIAMSREKWIEVMNLTSGYYNELIKRDLDTMPNAKESIEWEKRWGVDQQLITQRINAISSNKTFIDRGRIYNGLAQGRVDRGDWSLFHNGNYIDCHLHRELYKIFKKTDRQEIVEKKWREHTAMLQGVWPKENFQWYFDFLEKFAALA